MWDNIPNHDTDFEPEGEQIGSPSSLKTPDSPFDEIYIDNMYNHRHLEASNRPSTFAPFDGMSTKDESAVPSAPETIETLTTTGDTTVQSNVSTLSESMQDLPNHEKVKYEESLSNLKDIIADKDRIINQLIAAKHSEITAIVTDYETKLFSHEKQLSKFEQLVKDMKKANMSLTDLQKACSSKEAQIASMDLRIKSPYTYEMRELHSRIKRLEKENVDVEQQKSQLQVNLLRIERELLNERNKHSVVSLKPHYQPTKKKPKKSSHSTKRSRVKTAKGGSRAASRHRSSTRSQSRASSRPKKKSIKNQLLQNFHEDFGYGSEVVDLDNPRSRQRVHPTDRLLSMSSAYPTSPTERRSPTTSPQNHQRIRPPNIPSAFM
eukprot:CAMPEP_0117428132 /NCGR_PEP_ID=MMETSP0758-20121206/7915_1 /TAXON_ID=63605 /ORGANISM="Percolomonas cosmopolitus, Strain AE-1 (ATCC 50343)" /LENGTH=377 /DNA_ID=CAMNT_0005214333 /DNA_START=1071 /DNA_END=2201 /DNA_ORIENTATION=+